MQIVEKELEAAESEMDIVLVASEIEARKEPSIWRKNRTLHFVPQNVHQKYRQPSWQITNKRTKEHNNSHRPVDYHCAISIIKHRSFNFLYKRKPKRIGMYQIYGKQ